MTRLEQIRFNRLARHFVHRFVETELLAAGAEVHKIFVTAIALLAAMGAMFSGMLLLRNAFRLSTASADVQSWVALGDQTLLVSLIMAATGLFTVIGWDALLPDRRDAQILGALPLGRNVVLGAKLYAALVYFALLMVAAQGVPALVAPVVMFPESWLRAFFAQTVTLTAAAAFVFFGAMAVQGLLLLLLPYGRFQQVSAWLQMATLLVSLSLVFLTPNPGVAVSNRLHWAQWLPPYWFVDLWRHLGGQPLLLPADSTLLAVASTALLVAGAASTFVFSYRVALRKAVEGQPIAPSGPPWAARVAKWLLDNTLLRNPRERAVFWFTTRTVARHRGHRLMLSVYIGLGLTWVLSETARLLQTGLTQKALQPDPITTTIPLELAIASLIGLRVLFTLPVELRANWLFRLTSEQRSPAVERGILKFFLLAGVAPMALLPLPALLSFWEWRQALAHTWLYLLQTAIVVEWMRFRFHKIPFTCSWLPGKSNLQVKLGMYVILFVSLTSISGAIETSFLTQHNWTGLAKFSVFLLVMLAWRIWRRHDHASGAGAFVFEEQPQLPFESLQLVN
jgi:hypothetical protein